MCAEFTTAIGASLASSSISRLLSKSEPDLFEIKQIVINGTSDTIIFICHFIKRTKNKNILKRIFTKGETFEFEKDFKIKITNSVGEDVTRKILHYDTMKIVIPFNRFFEVPGRKFIIDARGRFRENFNDIFVIDFSKEPTIKDDQRIVYRTKIVVINKKYDAEEITFINIPFRQIFPIDFIGSHLFTQFELKAFHHLNKAKNKVLLQNRRRNQLRQKWGFDPENLNIVISHFLRALEKLVNRRYNDFIIVTSETHSVQVTKMDLEFPRVQEEGLPSMAFRPTICFDYSNRDPTLIDILISINKHSFLKHAMKLWHKFKSPKRTAPKKTLR